MADRIPSLRYKDVAWPRAPESLSVDTSDPKKVVVSGHDTVTGDGAYEWFRSLAIAFYDDRPGILSYPGGTLPVAYFAKLALREPPKEDRVGYDFAFWADPVSGEERS